MCEMIQIWIGKYDHLSRYRVNGAADYKRHRSKVEVAALARPPSPDQHLLRDREGDLMLGGARVWPAKRAKSC
ncbi:hypothetical protein SAMN05216276_1008219 [Streptosporangium subroseum]|uniref:Uncharacterized protein n=1 Tax=Streptosporangium subroseum TaxID=106412 RepID=A0A239E5B6_9ACTN|nr:hypothetical protein SAMN05216276_1008219 [Streptosporangium subroseum]